MTKLKKDRLVMVKNFPNRALAEAAREVLSQNGISCIVQSCDTVGAGTPQGIDLYVQINDRDAALELLETLYDGI